MDPKEEGNVVVKYFEVLIHHVIPITDLPLEEILCESKEWYECPKLPLYLPTLFIL